jgi:acetyltransferase-like isoleucine patch superfamily enzyme
LDSNNHSGWNAASNRAVFARHWVGELWKLYPPVIIICFDSRMCLDRDYVIAGVATSHDKRAYPLEEGMRRKLVEKYRFSEVGRDRWKSSQGLLSDQEKRDFFRRRIILYSYTTIKLCVLFPLLVTRGFAHLFYLAAELESLHFGPLRKVKRGVGCVVDRQTWLVSGQNIFMGDFVKISAYSAVMAGNTSTIRIGTNTIIGPGVTIVSFNHGHELVDVPIRYQDWKDTLENSVVIEEDVWIGANAVVLPGTKICCGSIVGAGVIVKGDVPPGSILINKQDVPVKKRVNYKIVN